LETRKIQLCQGEKYSFKLKGRGSAGYSWQHTIEGTPDSVEILIKTLSPKVKKTEDKMPPPTYNVDQLFTLIAKRKGHVKIHLLNHQSWEPKKEPLEELMLLVDIKE